MPARPPRTEEARRVLDEMAIAIDPQRLADQLRGYVDAMAAEFRLRFNQGEYSSPTMAPTDFTRNWGRVTAIYATIERVRQGAGLGGGGGPLTWEETLRLLEEAPPDPDQEAGAQEATAP